MFASIDSNDSDPEMDGITNYEVSRIYKKRSIGETVNGIRDTCSNILHKCAVQGLMHSESFDRSVSNEVWTELGFQIIENPETKCDMISWENAQKSIANVLFHFASTTTPQKIADFFLYDILHDICNGGHVYHPKPISDDATQIITNNLLSRGFHVKLGKDYRGKDEFIVWSECPDVTSKDIITRVNSLSTGEFFGYSESEAYTPNEIMQKDLQQLRKRLKSSPFI